MKRLNLKITEEMDEAIDKYMKQEPYIITKSNAIRNLIHEGLKFKGVA